MVAPPGTRYETVGFLSAGRARYGGSAGQTAIEIDPLVSIVRRSSSLETRRTCLKCSAVLGPRRNADVVLSLNKNFYALTSEMGHSGSSGDWSFSCRHYFVLHYWTQRIMPGAGPFQPKIREMNLRRSTSVATRMRWLWILPPKKLCY